MTITTDRITHLAKAPEGVVRLFVPTGVAASKRDLRNVAARVAGTIDVGRTPAGKPAKVDGVAGHVHDFSPVRRGGSRDDQTATPTLAAEDPRVAMLTSLGLSPEQVAAVLAAQPEAKPRQAKAAPKAKAPREVPAFLRKWEGVTCKTCRDFGKVRGPGAGDKAGRPFRTQHGADSAPTAVPCPNHGAGAYSPVQRSKGKASRTA